jgi:hypothetical protein
VSTSPTTDDEFKKPPPSKPLGRAKRKLGGPRPLDGRCSKARQIKEVEQQYLAILKYPRDPFLRRQVRHAAKLTVQVDHQHDDGLAKGLGPRAAMALGTLENRLEVVLRRLGIVTAPEREPSLSKDERILRELQGDRA